MATFKPSKPPEPIKINQFLGINESVGQTGLQLGEALRQVNYRITKDYKLQKRDGHNTFVDFGNEHDVQGLWNGEINGIQTLIACNNGRVYRDKSISGAVYDSLDTATYTNVDVVKTTALPGAESGSVGVDNVVILYNGARTKLTEVTLANVDLEASIGKFYFDADEKINYIVEKDLYANIAEARTALGTTTAYYRIGTITDAKTSMFYFESKLYFLTGTDFNYYDGTTYGTVESIAYVPTVVIGTPPAGGGSAYEPINLMTGAKKQEFIADGIATEYQFSEVDIDGETIIPDYNIDDDEVLGWVNGTPILEDTDFTVDRSTGLATTSLTYIEDTKVVFQWVKVETGNADLIKKNRAFLLFGPGNDTSVFLWGNPAHGNRRSWCASLDATYWPAFNFTNIGTNDSIITDIKTNNADYQIIFKEDRTHYSYPEYVTSTNSWDYPVKNLRDDVGNEVFNGVQIANNSPISIYKKSWWAWTNTAIEDERNADIISQRLEVSLSELDFSTAITFDYQSKKEYWCDVGENVYIWNYGNNTMYTYNNISATCFLDIDGVVYYGSQGTIERMEGYDDNGVEVIAQADTGFNSFGGINLLKSSDMVYIGLLPDTRTSLTLYFKTNKITEWKAVRKIAKYSLQDFDDVDFDDFSFNTNRNPQTFALEFSSNDYTFIQFRLENAEIDEGCTVLDFLLQAEVQGEV